MNSYNIQFGFNTNYNYSESSDSNTSLASPQLNYYEYNINNGHPFDINDQEMSDDSLQDSILCNKNLNTDFKPSVNRGGRKQVKVGTTKRNARERNRVRYINNCFEVLRERIPFEIADEQKNRKLSKVETLKYATIYIKQLTELLKSADRFETKSSFKPETNIDAAKKIQKISSLTSSISFNNININIYDTRTLNSDSYSPASSSSSSSSSSYNGQLHSAFSSNLANTTGYYNKNNCSIPVTYLNYEQQVNWHHKW